MDKIDFLLKKNNLNISCVESCSSGLLSSKLTSLTGSSKYFIGSFVLYNDYIKSEILNIDVNYIKKYNSVSKEICYLMAKKGKDIFNSDICISITGNHEANENSEVFIGINFNEVNIYRYKLNGRNRNENRTIIINQVIKLLFELLKKLP